MSHCYHWNRSRTGTAGHEIRRAREAAGLTQQRLAEKLGVTCLQIRRWELGIDPINAETYARLKMFVLLLPSQEALAGTSSDERSEYGN